MRILVVEDNIRLADTLAEALMKENYVVDVVHDGKKGYEYGVSGIYDLMILDVMLPLMNGYEILTQMRKDGQELPVLMLTAKTELEDKILGFERGADDYVTKPFEIRELIMRIQAILKRRGAQEIVNLQLGDLVLDNSACELKNIHTGKSMKIAGKEMQLLEKFLLNTNQVLEKEQIATKIWGYESDAEYNNVEVYVSFLRRKLNYLHVNIQIRTVRGVGYLLEECHDK
ncbi:MAG: response regulator transcription factor [bacterium]|nr:response regulator transcription factor [bacterium]